jgi:hypothetical protein
VSRTVPALVLVAVVSLGAASASPTSGPARAAAAGDRPARPAPTAEHHSYLLAGGFLVVDDFWGTREWESFERNMGRVFPDRRIQDGRLMVVINWNTDLGDAWEWAEQPHYPLKYSTFAYEMGVNLIIHAMSH